MYIFSVSPMLVVQKLYTQYYLDNFNDVVRSFLAYFCVVCFKEVFSRFKVYSIKVRICKNYFFKGFTVEIIVFKYNILLLYN